MTFPRTPDPVSADRFGALVAHELRSALTLLEARIDTALLRPRSAAYYEAALRQAKLHAGEVRGLLDAMLDLEKLERLPSAQEGMRCDLAEVASAVGVPWEDVHRSSGAPISWELVSAFVQGDPRLLGRMVVNFLDNALKYSPKDVHIMVRTGTEQGKPFLQVEDRGMGMTEEEVRQCLEPFWRAADCQEKVAGYGLGLPLVHRIVRLHGASLEIASRKGAGTTVRVTFPPLEEGNILRPTNQEPT